MMQQAKLRWLSSQIVKCRFLPRFYKVTPYKMRQKTGSDAVRMHKQSCHAVHSLGYELSLPYKILHQQHGPLVSIMQSYS